MGLKMKINAGDASATDYSEHLVSKPVTVSTTKEKNKVSQPTESVTVHPGVFSKKNSGMLVAIEGGRTINLGNYESAKVGITITIPCDPETLNEAYEWGTDWISAEIEKVTKEASGKS